MGEMNAYRILVGKPEGKRPLERPRRRRVNNIEMHHRERERERERMGGMHWIGPALDRYQWRALVNMVLNLRVP
jgi:hypothetical protein